MAYFAELSENNEVLRCISVSDNDCLDEDGNESEEIGVLFCKNLLGGHKWLQTSFSGRIRKNFASPGMLYYEEYDIFAPPAPAPWYMFTPNFDWEVPIGIHPQTGEPLQDWQWEYLAVAFAIEPDYSTMRTSS